MTTTLITTHPKRNAFGRLRNIAIVVMVVLCASLRGSQGRSLVASLLGEAGVEIGAIFMLLTMLCIAAFHYISRAKKNVGKITLNESSIGIVSSKGNESFTTNDLTSFKIRRSFSDINPKAMSFVSSYDNWILFDYNSKSYQCQFTIESSYADNELNKLIAYWKEHVTGFIFEKQK